MKRIFYIIFLFFVFQICKAKTIRVGNNYPIKTIKKAINLSIDGDTIVVYPGVYKEGNIIINKKIFFIGKEYPTLDGLRKTEILSIKSDDVLVMGFRLINSGVASLEDPCAIKVYNNDNVRIFDNKLDNNFFGIYLQNCTNCVVKNNKIRAYATQEQLIGNGIHSWKSDKIQVIGNHITGHRDGIYFEFVTNSIVLRNISVKNIRYGLHFMFSNNNSYISNIFRNNGAGVAVMFSKYVKMFRNVFDENWGDSAYGLLLKEISDSYIFNNKFIKNTSGIFMEGTSRIKVEKNNFISNGWGMKIQASCLDNEIVNNNFLKNTFDISTNGNLVLNTFDKNYWDKYEGYDLDKNGIGDVPYHPLSLFAVLSEKNNSTMLLYRSFMIMLLDKSEKVLPSITPDNFIDKKPLMKSLPL